MYLSSRLLHPQHATVLIVPATPIKSLSEVIKTPTNTPIECYRGPTETSRIFQFTTPRAYEHCQDMLKYNEDLEEMPAKCLVPFGNFEV